MAVSYKFPSPATKNLNKEVFDRQLLNEEVDTTRQTCPKMEISRKMNNIQYIHSLILSQKSFSFTLRNIRVTK